MKKLRASGFTLIEILLAVAALVILAGIVILAINPSKQLADTRNSKRQVDVNSILNAVYQYAIDNNGTIIATIPTAATTSATTLVCKAGVGGTCASGVDLQLLTASEKYLTSIPTDPTGVTTEGSGYHIMKSANGRITVSAPSTENGKPTISVTR